MMSLEQKRKMEEFLKEKAGQGGTPCEVCGSVGTLVVQDDPIGPPVWQPQTETSTPGIDPNRTFPFIVACCGTCHAAHLFPWGLVFGFAPKGEN